MTCNVGVPSEYQCEDDPETKDKEPSHCNIACCLHGVQGESYYDTYIHTKQLIMHDNIVHAQ